MIDGEQMDFHAACCHRLFGSAQPPQLPYSWAALNVMAEQIVRSHVAVPGVQPKLSLHLESGGARAGGRFTLVGLEGGYILKTPVELEGGYILKTPVERFPQMPELEHLTMRMAASFGIETAGCGLIAMQDGQLALIVKRMDRVGVRKLAMEDMCQLTDRMTEEKYRGSLETVGKKILQHCSHPGLDALRFFEVNLFSFLTGNSDMHLKNFSLIRSQDGEIRFSPAYDLLPTVLLLPEDTEESALTIQGRKKRLTLRDFLALGNALGLTDRQISNALRRFEKGLSAAIPLISAGFCSEEMKARYQELVERRWERLQETTASD
ncbi:MAG: HipA domain-containing protein [Verrucomicrobia bacterium]|nr:HipA domain-containing protein [Verrucomicrobiota bacterium]